MTPEDPSRICEAPSPDVAFVGLAQRAGAILQRMEQCTPPILPSQKHSAAAATPTATREILQAPPLVEAARGATYQGVYSDCDPPVPPHLSRTKYALPAPTRTIYDMVLKAYAKEPGPRRVAEQAEDVVWSIAARAVQLRRRTPPARDPDGGKIKGGGLNSDGRDALQPPPWPSLEHWHCVLTCWSRSTDPDRAYHAYAFLLAWREWHELCSRDRELWDASSTVAPGTVEEDLHQPPNVESLSLVLESCRADTAGEFGGTAGFLRAQKMGAGVTGRLELLRKEWSNEILV